MVLEGMGRVDGFNRWKRRVERMGLAGSLEAVGVMERQVPRVTPMVLA